MDTRTNKVVAIKRIDGMFEDATDCKRLLRELKLLKELDHENVTKLIEVIIPDEEKSTTYDEIYFVMNYCHSDLRKIIKS